MYRPGLPIAHLPPSLHPHLTINIHLVTSILKRLNPLKAPGPDRLRGRVLKNFNQLSGPLTRVFQQFLDSGSVPNQRKESAIIPNKTHPKDYIAVVLTSLLCQRTERTVGPVKKDGFR